MLGRSAAPVCCCCCRCLAIPFGFAALRMYAGASSKPVCPPSLSAASTSAPRSSRAAAPGPSSRETPLLPRLLPPRGCRCPGRRATPFVWVPGDKPSGAPASFSSAERPRDRERSSRPPPPPRSPPRPARPPASSVAGRCRRCAPPGAPSSADRRCSTSSPRAQDGASPVERLRLKARALALVAGPGEEAVPAAGSRRRRRSAEAVPRWPRCIARPSPLPSAAAAAPRCLPSAAAAASRCLKREPCRGPSSASCWPPPPSPPGSGPSSRRLRCTTRLRRGRGSSPALSRASGVAAALPRPAPVAGRRVGIAACTVGSRSGPGNPGTALVACAPAPPPPRPGSEHRDGEE